MAPCCAKGPGYATPLVRSRATYNFVVLRPITGAWPAALHLHRRTPSTAAPGRRSSTCLPLCLRQTALITWPLWTLIPRARRTRRQALAGLNGLRAALVLSTAGSCLLLRVLSFMHVQGRHITRARAAARCHAAAAAIVCLCPTPCCCRSLASGHPSPAFPLQGRRAAPLWLVSTDMGSGRGWRAMCKAAQQGEDSVQGEASTEGEGRAPSAGNRGAQPRSPHAAFRFLCGTTCALGHQSCMLRYVEMRLRLIRTCGPGAHCSPSATFRRNACSSCHGDDTASRKYLILPALKSGRVYGEGSGRLWDAGGVRSLSATGAAGPRVSPGRYGVRNALVTQVGHCKCGQQSGCSRQTHRVHGRHCSEL